ncbi:hypothetical protein DGN07_12290 [Xanthomonas citri pv. fuscans]|nr:hypothetical protein DGN07_12290 [Xanthomonas citri pv. fuscans]
MAVSCLWPGYTKSRTRPETARRRSIFHQRIQIGFPGRSFVVDLQSYFSSLLSNFFKVGHFKDCQTV